MEWMWAEWIWLKKQVTFYLTNFWHYSLLVFIHLIWKMLKFSGKRILFKNVNLEDIKMEKPFDIADLLKRLEAIGLPVAEDLAKKATKEIFDWAKESCALKGGLFAVAVPLLPIVADQVIKLEDKIDGVEGA